MTILDVLVQCLALARLLRLFIEDDGPFRLLAKFRALIGVGEYGEAKNDLAELFSCYWCLGIWFSPMIYFCYLHIPWVVWVLAVAQGSGLLYALMERIEYAATD